MPKTNLFLPIGLTLLTACGGGSSSGSGDNGVPSGSNAPVVTPTTGEEFTATDGNYVAEVNGISFETSLLANDFHTGQPILNQYFGSSERKAYIAIEGDYVMGFGGSYSNDDGSISDFAFYGLTGAVSQSSQSGTVQYEGSYMLANASDPSSANFSYQASLTVNFDTGTITGNTLDNGSSEEQVSFSGNINGNNITMTISDQFGVHNAFGAAYGPNAEEIAAGFQDGSVSGLLYAEQ